MGLEKASYSKAKKDILDDVASSKTVLSLSSGPNANPNCEVCLGAGFVTYDRHAGHPEFGKAFPCQCNQPSPVEFRRTMAVLRLKADTDAMFREKVNMLERQTFGSFRDRPDLVDNEQCTAAEQADSLQRALVSAQMLATGEAKYSFLVLDGTYGNGKTHIATAALNHVLNAGGQGMFVKVPTLLRALREGFADETYSSILATLTRTPFLVLDDYGANKDTEWSREQLYMLIDDRYEARAKTILTTNEPEEQWEPRVKDRLKSWHNGVSKVVAISAPSYRTGAA